VAIVCPTILAETPEDYERQIDRIAGFAERIQVDLSDGVFAPSKTVNPVQAWWPKDIAADLHMMFQRPAEHIETIISLRPSLVIIHAEAEGDLVGLVNHLKKFAIRTGVALLADTKVEDASSLLGIVDHALIFSGELGHFGGKADLRLLDKAAAIREQFPDVEIGWDGGANLDTIEALVAGGIDVVNVGGAIQRSDEPEEAYATLVAKLIK